MKRSALIMVTLLAGAALMFAGCNNGTTDTTDTTDTTSGTTTKASPDIDFNTTTISLSTPAGYGTAEIIADPDDASIKVAHIVAGSWMTAGYTYASPVDISGKKIKITLKCSASYTQGSGLFKLIFVTDDTHETEITSNDVGNVGWCNPITTTYTSFTGSDTWIAYSIANVADLTSISKIIINPQSGAGDIYIKSIEFVD